MSVPFQQVSPGQIEAANVSIAPDGTKYAVPSGMHERLFRAVVPDAAAGTRDPKTELALAGWVSLHTDGLTRRVYIDAPDDFTETAILKRFARSHDAESIVMARHPSGNVTRWQSPSTVCVTEQ
ncbi:hypothetical protein GOC83_13480 [Haloarcula rubripromontorii]|uniref:Uncharacterized protein n=1 Tax=Haloarcula rubripromontorii TaxID=1705562 RepID=A0A847TMA0_9EURY|nr:hypothetical protein [Haloarcula rubripromontorii]NLV07142.1 hypothetical protein [Haloarcula rubripromontorii]